MQLHVSERVAQVHVVRQQLDFIVRCYERDNLAFKWKPKKTLQKTTWGHLKISGGSCFSMLCSMEIKFKLTKADTEKCTVFRRLYLP
jgi:hypothetical protein